MTARIAFLGDTLLGSKAQPTLDREGYGHALADLASLLADADLVIANHEGPISADAPPMEKAYGARRPSWRRADPKSLQALVDVGIGVVGLGNNHMLDHGVAGLADSLDALDAAGITRCGAGLDSDEAARPAALTVSGERIVVISALAMRRNYFDAGYYAAPGRPGPALLDADLLDPDPIHGVDHGLRIVLAHWGPGYGPVDDEQNAMAAALRAAGADLVVGTHPHSAQLVRVGEGAPVLFSLGNGAYGSGGRFTSRGAPPYGLVATVEVDGGAIVAIELRPILTDNKVVEFRPRPAADEDGMAFLHSLLEPDASWGAIPGGARWERT